MRHLSAWALIALLSAPATAHDPATTDTSAGDAAREAGLHATLRTGTTRRACNPGQGFDLEFDGRGLGATAHGGAWSWGLDLLAWGRRGALTEVVAPGAVRSEGPRVTYAWDGTLDEWYVNGRGGLEHGYTLHRRPAGDEALQLRIGVRGELAARLLRDGRDVRFEHADGSAALEYAGLVVFDAQGTELPARFHTRDDELLLSVDDAGAHYPVTIDPMVQQAYIKASNTATADTFGFSISLDGEMLAVGTIGDDSAAVGIDGDDSDDSLLNSGSVFVFERTPLTETWAQQAYVKASNPDFDDFFGSQVAISGDTLAVGAVGEDSAATGVDGDQSDNSALSSGAVYVFVRDPDTRVWSQQAYIKASNTDAQDDFGGAVALSGDRLIVGARREDSGATSVDGNQTDNSAQDAGAAYIFERDPVSGVWSQAAYLKADNAETLDRFGDAVAIDGDLAVVGAFFEDSNVNMVGGNGGNNDALQAGAAYVFARDPVDGSWSQEAYLKALQSDANDRFGGAVAISGTRVAVGAAGEDSNATTVNGNQNNGDNSNSGAAYTFLKAPGTGIWAQEAFFKASNNDEGDEFGISVALDGDRLVVGAEDEDSNAMGFDGNGNNDTRPDAGAAYVFTRDPVEGTWSQLTYVKASNSGALDQFGDSVAVEGDSFVVSALCERSGATGINGDQEDDLTLDAGAVYAFDLDDVWSDQGCALAGADGEPRLVGTGDLMLDSENAIDLTGAAPSAVAALFFAIDSMPVPFKGGTLKPVPTFKVFLINTNPEGAVSIPFEMPPNFPADIPLWAQWAIVDAGAEMNIALSNAVRGITP